MENLIPRPNPPQPKSLHIDPPSYSVPDVTLMFDSDDSLIWKPGENLRNINSNHPRTQNCYNVQNSPQFSMERERNLGTENSKNMIDINKHNNDGEKFSAPVFHSTDVKSKFAELQFSNKNSQAICASASSPHSPLQNNSAYNKNYYPELYCSPKQDIVSQIRRLPTLLKSNHEADVNENWNSQNPNFIKRNHCFSKADAEDYVHFDIKSRLNNEKPNTCDCCQNIESLGNKITPLSIKHNAGPVKVDENKCQNQNQHILKIVEEQNQHILYLQAILEKLLQAQNINDNKNYQDRCNDENKTVRKEACTQTYLSNDEQPTKKTVATNTTISWTDLTSSNQKLNDKKQMCYPKDLFTCKYDKSKHDPNDNRKKSPIEDTDSHSALLGNNSLTLRDVQIGTVFNPPSPEPSLYIDVPDYHDDNDQSFDHTHQNYDNRLEDANDEENYMNSPLLGESAMVYNERLSQNDAFMQCQHEESAQDEKNGVTFYNKVMINVQQILHRSEDVKKHEKYDRYAMQRNRKASVTRMGRAEAIYQQAVGPTKQQLQQFGISFLDPLTLQDKRRVSPMADAFYTSDRPINMGQNLHDLEILNDIRNERRIHAHNQNVEDSRLALIAQNSPRVFNTCREKRFTPPQDKITPKQKTGFSFATEEFLGKYVQNN